MAVNFFTDQYLQTLRAVPWHRYLIVLAISFLCASVLSLLVGYFLVPDAAIIGVRQGESKSPSFAISASGSTLDSAGIDVILKRNIFNSEGELGDQQKATGQAQQDVDAAEIPKSDLPLKLVGIIFGGTPENGLALIENTAKNRFNSFLVGDTIVEDAILGEVYPDKVILKRGTRMEYLDLERKEPQRRSRKKAKKEAVPLAGNTGLTQIATRPPPLAFEEDGLERKGTDVKVTQSYMEKLLTVDMPKVLQDAKAVPNMVGGEIRGYKLERIREDSIYEKLGLQNLDIIEEINGAQLGDVKRTIGLLQQMRKEKNVEVRINRGGTIMNVKISVE